MPHPDAPRSARPQVGVVLLDALGWATLAAVAWGGLRIDVAGRSVAAVDVGLLAAPWMLLCALAGWRGRLARLEDLTVVRAGRGLLRAAARRPALALVAAAAAYTAVLLAHAFRQYAVHASGAYDLGIFAQVVWSTLHGGALRSSLKGDVSILADHFEPVLALLAPLDLLWDDPRSLLVFQTLAVAAGVVPAYLLARRRFGPGALAVVFALAYLVYAPTRNVNAYHFHPVALVMPLLLCAALWLEEGRAVPFGLALVLASGCQENVPLVIAGWGASLALARPRRPLLGGALALGGTATFLALLVLVIPWFAGAERFGYLERYAHLGHGVGEVLRTLLGRPWILLDSLVRPPPKIEYLLRVFGGLAFLPLAPGGRRWLLPVLPVLLQNVLSLYPHMWSVGFQYTAPMTPFLLLGAMDGARGLLARGLGRRAVAPRAVGLAVAIGLVAAGGESQVFQARELRGDPRYARIEPHLAALPREASVSAQAGVFSHVAHRHHAYLFPDRVGQADYVVVDRKGFLYGFQPPRAELEQLVRELPRRGYVLRVDQEGFLVFERRARLRDDPARRRPPTALPRRPSRMRRRDPRHRR